MSSCRGKEKVGPVGRARKNTPYDIFTIFMTNLNVYINAVNTYMYFRWELIINIFKQRKVLVGTT